MLARFKHIRKIIAEQVVEKIVAEMDFRLLNTSRLPRIAKLEIAWNCLASTSPSVKIHLDKKNL